MTTEVLSFGFGMSSVLRPGLSLVGIDPCIDPQFSALDCF